MNKQAGYIAQAHLILTAIAASTLLLSKIPFSTVDPNKETAISITIDNTKDNTPAFAQGKALFISKCASCHNIFKDMTGPKLGAALSNGQWDDRQKLYRWIRTPQEFMRNDSYTQGLYKQYGTLMPGFPTLTDKEIDLIVEYIASSQQL